MAAVKGKFIVIEGTDGSGKGTQFQKLVERLNAQNVPFATFDFPQYGKPSAYFVEQYLNGRYGATNENGSGLFTMDRVDAVSPEAASLFFALDRFDVRKDINDALAAGKLVLSNRYVTSNMGHQGAKITRKADRARYLKWLDNIEYGILGAARPDVVVLLHVPAAIAQQLIAKKAERAYLEGAKKDIHEKNLDYLKHAEQVYLEIAGLFPEQFIVVECVEGGHLLDIDQIAEKVWQKVQPLIAK